MLRNGSLGRYPTWQTPSSQFVPFVTRMPLFHITFETTSISAAQLELFTPIWSPWIIGELYRVLTWNWAKKKGF